MNLLRDAPLRVSLVEIPRLRIQPPVEFTQPFWTWDDDKSPLSMCPRIDDGVYQSQCVSRKSLKASIVGVISVGQPPWRKYTESKTRPFNTLVDLVTSWIHGTWHLILYV